MLRRFSANYSTFEEWLDCHPDTRYRRRIARLRESRKTATLDELRGHGDLQERLQGRLGPKGVSKTNRKEKTIPGRGVWQTSWEEGLEASLWQLRTLAQGNHHLLGVLGKRGECVLCGHTFNPGDLVERNIAARRNARVVVNVCGACHMTLERLQRTWDPCWERKDNSPDLKRIFLKRGIADALGLLAQALKNEADQDVAWYQAGSE